MFASSSDLSLQYRIRNVEERFKFIREIAKLIVMAMKRVSGVVWVVELLLFAIINKSPWNMELIA